MADVNAQSVEDFSDRTIYRYAGGRYEQTLTSWVNVFTVGLKTLVNLDTSRTYVVPRSGLPSRFYKIIIEAYLSVLVTESTIGQTLIKTTFFKMSIPSLNFDGKSQQTDFYSESTEQYVTSPQLRAINIGNILAEPQMEFSNIQNTSLSALQFQPGAGTTGLVGIIRPTVIAYKK